MSCTPAHRLTFFNNGEASSRLTRGSRPSPTSPQEPSVVFRRQAMRQCYILFIFARIVDACSTVAATRFESLLYIHTAVARPYATEKFDARRHSERLPSISASLKTENIRHE